MKASTPELLKFQKLMRRLKESRRGTIGLLEGMWIAVARNCPQGDIGRFTNEEIAIMVDWDGDPDELTNALVDCRWLDRCEVHRLIVHDWHDHCPTYVKGGLAKKEKQILSAISPEVEAIAISSEVQPKVPAKADSAYTSEVASTYSILSKPIQAKPSDSYSSELLQASEPVDSSLVFELVGKDSAPWSPPLALIEQFESWYPSLDVSAELRQAAAWHATNRTKRKTRNGITKFLNGWLTKANDKGGKKQKAVDLDAELDELQRQCDLKMQGAKA